MLSIVALALDEEMVAGRGNGIGFMSEWYMYVHPYALF